MARPKTLKGTYRVFRGFAGPTARASEGDVVTDPTVEYEAHSVKLTTAEVERLTDKA